MVDFPDPLGPMIASFSPALTSKSKSSRMRVSPYRLLTPLHWMIGDIIGGVTGVSPCNFALQLTKEQRSGVTDREEDQSQPGIGLRVAIVHPGYLPRGAQQLRNRDHGEQRRFFEHSN